MLFISLIYLIIYLKYLISLILFIIFKKSAPFVHLIYQIIYKFQCYSLKYFSANESNFTDNL